MSTANTDRAIRLATMAIIIRDGHTLDVEKVCRMFDVHKRTAQRDLEDVGAIVPVCIETKQSGPGRRDRQLIYRRMPKEAHRSG